MQVIFINSLSEMFGTTIRCRAMVQCLRESGHEVFYTEARPSTYPDAEIIYQEDSAYEYGKAIRRRIEFIDRYPEADVLYISKLNALTLPLLVYGRYKRLPIVVDWDDCDSYFQTSPARTVATRLVERASPRYIPILTTHNGTIMAYAKRRGARNVFIVPQVVDNRIFEPNRFQKERERKRLLIPEDHLAIALAITLNQGGARDIDLIFRTMEILKTKKLPVLLIVIGGGSHQYFYQQKAKELFLDNISWTGWEDHDKVPRLLSACDAGIVLMREDKGNVYRFSLKCLEYLFMDLPIIGSVYGATQNALKPYLDRIIPSDPEMMAAALESFYYEKTMSDDHSTVYNEAVRRDLEKHFGIRKMRTALESIIEKVKLLKYY